MTSQEHLVPYLKEITMKSNSRFIKTAVATGLIVVTGAAALGITSFASAQVAEQPSAVVVAVDDPATDTTTPSAETTPQHKGEHKGEHKGGRKGGPGKFNREGLASVLKMTTEEVMTELRAGKSLAAIAEAQKVDVADVKSQLTNDFKAHLAEKVTAEKYTQAEVDAKLEQFESRLDDMVNKVRPAGPGMGRGMGGHKGGMGQHSSN
jgi:phenylpyruvate tautomerase PptA (4-oxalocrotonate tautomerase family)